MLKILSSQSRTITGAAIIIAGATLINKFVGIARDRTIAHYFGAGPVTDAYYAAFKIPDLIYNLLVVGALTAGFIPIFTKLFYAGENKNPAWKMANNILNILGLALLFFCAIGIAAAPWISRLIAPGFLAENMPLVVSFSRILFLSPIFLGASMVMGGVLQSLRQFVLYSIAPIFYNLGIIFGAVVIVPFVGPIGLAIGVVLGAFMHFILQFFGAWHAGYRWRWVLNFKDKAALEVGRLMVPRSLGLAVSQTHTIITTVLASLLPIGSVAAYSFADNLHYVPIGIIGVSFAMAIFPVLSLNVAQNNLGDFKKNLSAGIRQIIFLITPCIIIFLLLRAQIVRVVFGSGAFDWTATITTANALAFFALGMLADSLIPLLARAFFALSDTKTPLFTGLLGSLASIISALLLMRPLGVAGLALAGVVGGAVALSLLTIFMRKKIGSFADENIIPTIYKIAIAGLGMAAMVQIMKYPLAKIFDQNYFWGIFGQGFIAGLAGLSIYAILCYIMKLQELSQIMSSLRKKWLRLRNVQSTEIIETKE
ncbi:murein biosynthesis integral membrane protein MurJ [Patescibacteria group bacterium]|nr:murein biosynthesis integral membrane protein MurJ [Patescibacteria group bacterium]